VGRRERSGSCILVSGPGHSATRLVVRLLERHPDVCVPRRALNGVAEYAPLHRFFIRAMDRTSLDSADYQIDRDQLGAVLDAYMEHVDESRPFFVLKMPYYPLNCLELFFRYYGGRVVPVYCRRPPDKIVRSFLARGEDALYFAGDPAELLRQVKKLGPERRKEHLEQPAPQRFFQELVAWCEHLREAWDRDHPASPFVVLDVEELGRSEEYLLEALRRIGLRPVPARQMLRLVDRDRLMQATWLRHRLLTGRLAAAIRPLVPAGLRSLSRRLLGG
jgi:hypothetical protein